MEKVETLRLRFILAVVSGKVEVLNIYIYKHPPLKHTSSLKMDIRERIQSHLKTELGPSYKDLAAAAERDNATRASDKAFFYILIVSIFTTFVLVFYRLWVHTKVRQQTLKLLKEEIDYANHYRRAPFKLWGQKSMRGQQLSE